jgi:hypothetical protein
LYLVACIVPMAAGMALSMSPMTASIMSAVPIRRAGAGSAMNDATRELGASLGVAVLGSLLSSRYTHRLHRLAADLPAPARGPASASLGGALRAATRLPAGAADAFTTAARAAFVDGLRLAVSVGGVLSVAAAIIVYRSLPHSLGSEADLHGGTSGPEQALSSPDAA